MALFVSVLLDAALHVSEGAVHALGEALLDLPVVLLHLQGQRQVCASEHLLSGSSKFQHRVIKTWFTGFMLLTAKAPETL